jgi:hypothetical protein
MHTPSPGSAGSRPVRWGSGPPRFVSPAYREAVCGVTEEGAVGVVLHKGLGVMGVRTWWGHGDLMGVQTWGRGSLMGVQIWDAVWWVSRYVGVGV